MFVGFLIVCLLEYVRQKKMTAALCDVAYPKLSTVLYDGHEFQVKVVENSGYKNNCLGYALGNFLKCLPCELRESFKRIVVKNSNNEDFLERVKLSLINEHQVVEPLQNYGYIMNVLDQNCFLPVDLFLIWCEDVEEREKLLIRSNVVFFVKRANHYEPVIHFFSDISLSTCYIGCDHFHYEQLIMQKKKSLWFDLVYFNHVLPGT